LSEINERDSLQNYSIVKTNNRDEIWAYGESYAYRPLLTASENWQLKHYHSIDDPLQHIKTLSLATIEFCTSSGFGVPQQEQSQ